jgi:hypothetical protein
VRNIAVKIFLFSMLAALLFSGCKNLFHPEGPQKKDNIITYTVTFNINGGSGTTPDPQTVNPDRKITLPNEDGFAKDGFILAGWSTTDSDYDTGDNYRIGGSFPVNGNVTLYAMWADPNDAVVTFNANGGSRAPDKQVSILSLPLPGEEDVFRKGYKFTGWNTNAAGTGTDYASGLHFTYPLDITLYAQWRYATVLTESLAVELKWLKENALSGVNYTIQVGKDEPIAPANKDNGYATELSYTGETNIRITLTGVGAVRTVSLASNGSMFTVENGVTLILGENITLQGRTSNNASLVRVNSGGTLIMNTGSLIIGNTSPIGGGVYVASGGTFTMNGGKIGETSSRKNTSPIGGGVYVASGGTFTMQDGKISYNTATGTVTVTGLSNTSATGGGVYVAGTFTMRGGEISNNNSTSYEGGVHVAKNGIFTMDGGKITDNTSTSAGGGVGILGTFIMSGNAEISGNKSTNSSGGGVNIGPGGTFNMSGSAVISRNTASVGGGVAVGGATFTMSGGEISGNIATGTSAGGGGVYVDAGAFIMNDDAKISGNISKNNGGGVYVGSGGTFTMYNGEISGNTQTTISGGGVFVTNGTFTMHDGKILGNKANNNGGGVDVYNGGTFTMHKGEISGNEAKTGHGGGVFVNGGSFTMNGEETKIFGNTASSDGGGVRVENGTFNMRGGVIYGNTAKYGGGVSVHDAGGRNFKLWNGTIYGSNEADTSLRNKLSPSGGSGVALYFPPSNTRVQRRTLNGSTWTWTNLSTTNNTIRVDNPDLQ